MSVYAAKRHSSSLCGDSNSFMRERASVLKLNQQIHNQGLTIWYFPRVEVWPWLTLGLAFVSDSRSYQRRLATKKSSGVTPIVNLAALQSPLLAECGSIID